MAPCRDGSRLLISPRRGVLGELQQGQARPNTPPASLETETVPPQRCGEPPDQVMRRQPTLA